MGTGSGASGQGGVYEDCGPDLRGRGQAGIRNGINRKRAGSKSGPPGKKPRVEISRPRCVDEDPPASMVHGGCQYGRGTSQGCGFEAGRGSTYTYCNIFVIEKT